MLTVVFGFLLLLFIYFLHGAAEVWKPAKRVYIGSKRARNEAARLRKGAKRDGNGVCRRGCGCSLEGSPSSCLASSDGIPGSVPSDCRLAPLPPSLAHAHTHTQTSPINCSSLIFISPMWGSEAFAYPQFTLWKRTLLSLLFLSVSHLFFTCVY